MTDTEWIDADYYMSGDFGSLADENGEFLLFMREAPQTEPFTTVGTIDGQNRWCDDVGDPLKYDHPLFKAIAVAELPKPEDKYGYDAKTAKDFK